MRLNLLKKIAYTFMSSFIKIVATQIVNCAYLQSCIQMLGMYLLFVYVSVCDDQPTCLSPICFAWKSGPFFSSYRHNSVWIRDSLRADVSYFLCCTRKRKIVPFPRATKEIRDVCTRAKFGGTPPGGVTWVNVCWVCAAGLSKSLPHYSLFFDHL